MNRFLKLFIVIASCVNVAVASPSSGAQLYNDGWRFTLSDKPEYTFQNYKRDDSWRDVQLPHDWSIGLPISNDKTIADGATGYFPGGIGWYNKSFEKPITKDQKCYIIFDGVYNNSEYWINGKRLGEHPYGYSPFYYDITDYLKPVGQSNELMVRVDHSHFADSRWYTGSGIYRDVKMLIVDKLHIPVWGTYITTPYISDDRATVSLDIDLQNDYTTTHKGVVITDIVDPSGEVVASSTTQFDLNGGGTTSINQLIEVAEPQLWGLQTPNLYYAKSRVVVDSEIKEERTTRFGFRTIKFDAATGFYLNGENMKIKGVCLHHDGGLVGAAVPRAVWERRLKTLKEGGCNAIRASHNPCSEEFLEICDEMGILVQQEFFDEWDHPKDKRFNTNEKSVDYATRGYDRHFQEWAERDLKTTMLRDRNHPSVFQWSIGNEIEWTYEGNKESTGFFGADAAGGYFWNQPPYSPERIKAEWKSQPEHTYDIGETAHKLAGWVRELDLTRPVTANCILPSISYETGYIDALDVAGFSYRRVMYDYAHKYYPEKPVMGTENVGHWHEWKAVEERDYIPGMFIWTGVEYIGEQGGRSAKFPKKSSSGGIVDLAGFPKPSYHMMKSLWVDEPFIAIYSQVDSLSAYRELDDGRFEDANPKKPWNHKLWGWDAVNAHWNYDKGEKVVVELYSNCEEIELFQNGKSLGKKRLSEFEDHIYKWGVVFSDGSITAKGTTPSGAKGVASVVTAGDAASVRLTVDKSQMRADNVDAIHVVAQLVDKRGREIKHLNKLVEFSVEGDCKVLGVDNGYAENPMSFQSNKVTTSQGRCLLILQSTNSASNIEISATAEGLSSNRVKIESK